MTMSIDSSDVVDGLGISKADGKAVLIISDHLPWDDQEAHFSLIERKIGAYLALIASGQVVETLPAAKGKAVRIELVYEHVPTTAAGRFLTATRTQLQSNGVEFIAMSLPNVY